MDAKLIAMKALILIALLVAAVGCTSTKSTAIEQTPEGVVLLSDQSLEPTGKSDRFLGNLRSSWSDHLKSCRTGVEFTGRSIARNTERGWARLVWLVQ